MRFGRGRQAPAAGTPTVDRLYRARFDRWIMVTVLVVMGVMWILPAVAAVERALVFNGWKNFGDVIFGDIGGITVWRTYGNSFAIALIHASVVVVVSSLAGYGFAKFSFRGKEIMYYTTLVFLSVPATSVLVPLFYITRGLDLRDSFLGVALPEAALTLPFGVLLMRNFAETISDTFIEAASIDGAGHFRIYRDVFLPLSRPAVLSLGTLSIMWSLQDFLFPSLFFTDERMTTAAQAVLRFKEYLGATPDDVGRYNASLVLLAVPALIVVIGGLRFITSGLTAGGVKE
ncbi:MAG: carbohydrate ABC transporter permease [bacterium]|nr:carbohydrate ABC transporter permease [bacterium]